MPHPRLFAVAALAACALSCAKRQAPVRPPEPPGPVFRVPEGCRAPVQGHFAHEEHRDWRYVAQDDGVQLVLEVRAPRSGTPAQVEAMPLRITLRRSPDGFLGFAEARVGPEGAAGCRLEYPTRLAACEEHVLTLETLDELAVDEDTCEVAAPPEGAPWRTHRLIRLPPPEVLPEDAPAQVPPDSPPETSPES